MGRLVLTLLGGFQAHREGGHTIDLPGRKAQALLAFLALPPGVTHPRDKLAALIWPELPAPHARANLRQVLFALRHALAFADPLRIDGDTIALDPTRVDVDTAAFEHAVREAAPEQLARALAAYRGDLMAGLRGQEAPYEEWLATERERLRECALDGLARLLAHQRATGDVEAAVQTALRTLAIDPLQEPVHRALMRLFATLGRRADALRQYHLCVTSLRRDLDVDPEVETKELYQSILRRHGNPAANTSVVDVGRDDRAELRWQSGDDIPLVGRASERALLAAAVAAAWAGHPRGVALIGDAGIGKSRLVSELIGETIARRGRVVAGRAFETEQVLPFRPWIDALRTGGVTRNRQLLDALTPLHRAALADVFPEVGVASASAGGFDFLRLFEAITELIRTSAARHPILVVLEDLHWADEMSLRLLPYLGRQLRDDRVLVLITLRGGETAPTPMLQHTLDELRRDARVALLPIDALSRAETTLLAAQLSPHRAASPELDAQIWQASRGNPLIIVETLRAVGAGSLGSEAGSTLPMATAVRELVTRQLDRLSDAGHRVATAAAVIAQEFDFALLPAVAELDEERAAEAVEELVRHRLLRDVGGRFELLHDRIRQIVYEQILAPRRRLLHRRVAATLRAAYADDLAPHVTALATHYRSAGAWNEAAEFLEKAGLAAAAHSAHLDAASLFEQAILALDRLPDTPSTIRRACELEFRLGYSLAHAGNYERALEQYDAGIRLAERLHDGQRLWWARCGRASVLASMGRYADALSLADEVLANMAAVDDHRGRFWCRIQLARVTYALGDYRGSTEHCRRAVESLDLAPSKLGAFAESGAVVDELTALGGDQSHVTTHGHIVANGCIGLFHATRGDVEPAIARLEPTFELCRRVGAILLLALVAGPLGAMYVLAGRAAEAIALLEDVLARARARDYAFLVDELEIRLGEAYLSAGRLTDAQRVLAGALHRARTSHARGMEAEALRALGTLAGSRPAPDLEAASGHLETASAVAGQMGMRPLEARCSLDLGRIRHLQGRRDEARALLGRAAGQFRAMGMASWLLLAETAIQSLG